MDPRQRDSGRKPLNVQHTALGGAQRTGASGQWPPSLRAYVDRCFAQCTSDADRDRTEAYLRRAIEDAIRSAVMYSRDWSSFPLPVLNSGAISAAVPSAANLAFSEAPVDPRRQAGRQAPTRSLPKEVHISAAPHADTRQMTCLPPPRHLHSHAPAVHQVPHIAKTGHPPISKAPHTAKSSKYVNEPMLAHAQTPDIRRTQTADEHPARAQASHESSLKRSERAARFERETRERSEALRLRESAPIDATLAAMADDGVAWDGEALVGTSTALEKPYLRLTSAPDPATVRPLPVLRRALDHAVGVWRRGDASYGYTCEQLKSVRQDLTVQRISGVFAVRVYEAHARVAIEAGDLGEYSQCQGQLKVLYAAALSRTLGGSGASSLDPRSSTSASRSALSTAAPGDDGDALQCWPEFVAYRVLYLLLTGNRLAMAEALLELPEGAETHAEIAHALEMRRAHASGDYVTLLRLGRTVPRLGGHIAAHFLDRERASALRILIAAHRPTLSVARAASFLSCDTATVLRMLSSGLGSDLSPHLSADGTAIDTRIASSALEADI